MDRDLLSHLPIILAVARRKSFVGAASELGMGASAVSHSVRLVEERLGIPLFARTTRSVALTLTCERSSTADPDTISPTRTSVAVWSVSVKLHPLCEEKVCPHAVAASRNRMAGLIT